MLDLRPYQAVAKRKLLASPGRMVIGVLPTGAGKTVLFGSMVRDLAAQGLRTWIITHRSELLEQASRMLDRFGVPHGRLVAGSEISPDRVQCCSIQMLTRRLERVPRPDVMIIDEAHHCCAKTYPYPSKGLANGSLRARA